MSSDQPWASRVLRLDALKALLAERDYTTVADLAEELGVSTRTLHRDLALLRGMGVPVEGDRGSGVGCTSSPGGRLAEFTSTSLRHSACCSASRSPKRWARRFCWTICAPSPARLVQPSPRLRRGGSSRCAGGSWLGRPHPRRCSPATRHPDRRSQGAARGVRAAEYRARTVRGPARRGHRARDRAPVPLLQPARLACPGLGPAPRRHPLLPHRPHPGRPGATRQVPAAAARPVPGGR
jgi:biotin operon repressor